MLAERTLYEEIFRDDITCVRHYLPLAEDSIPLQDENVPVSRETFAVPLVLVTPLAATTRIYDLFPDRSLVKYLRARCFDVYLVDWGRPGRRHDAQHLADFYGDILPRAIAAVRTCSGRREISLHGWSFGGLFATCYTALGDPDVRNLVLIGVPCDYHANGELGKQYQRLARQMHFLEKTTGFRVHDTHQRWWHAPGWANSLGFKLLSPAATMQGYLALLRNLHDRNFVAAHATNAAFLDDMTAYPGGVIQDMVQYLLVDNCLARGRLPEPHPRADWSAVRANVITVAGTGDTRVTVDAAKHLLGIVSSRDKTLLAAPGGHMGIVGGSRAPQAIWKPVADWLAERSR